MQKVGLTQADAAVDQQGIIGLGGGVGHGQAGGLGQAVAGTDYKIIKAVAGIQMGFCRSGF